MDSAGLAQVARSAAIDDFSDEQKETAEKAAALIMANPAFQGASMDPYTLAQAFGADQSYRPPTKVTTFSNLYFIYKKKL